MGRHRIEEAKKSLDEVGGRWGQKKEMTFFATPALTVLNRLKDCVEQWGEGRAKRFTSFCEGIKGLLV